MPLMPGSMAEVEPTRRAGAQESDRRFEVVTIETPSLGDRSYVIACNGQAVVMDPQRDIDRVQSVLQTRGWVLTHVVETHIHNDYVSGGLELAAVTGAEYVVPAHAGVAYPIHSVDDEDTFTSGGAIWRAVHTPGHTPHHMSYVVSVDGVDRAVFTGGSMLFGSVGRPDLLGDEFTVGLAHDQWHSVRRLVDVVADEADVLPTHGFGSFCSATETVGLASTVGDQRTINPALTLSQPDFVDQLLAGLDAFPAYYAHMGPANSAGPEAVDLSLPELADANELRRRIEAGEWVVDLRQRKVFAEGHVRGSLSFDLEGNAVTYLGWLIPWGTPITLVGESRDQVRQMQRELVRIGIDRPAAHAVGSPEDLTSSAADIARLRAVGFADLVAAQALDSDLPLVDLRRRLEWSDGHLVGARHLPLHDLLGRLDEVVAWSAAHREVGGDGHVWIYCGSGFRAAVAASMMQRVGITVIFVDEDFDQAAARGATIVLPETAPHRLGPAVTA